MTFLARRMCPEPYCQSHKNCPYGYAKYSNGCNTCECENPCKVLALTFLNKLILFIFRALSAKTRTKSASPTRWNASKGYALWCPHASLTFALWDDRCWMRPRGSLSIVGKAPSVGL